MIPPATGRREPVFNLPGIVSACILVILAVHGLRALLGERTDFTLLLDLAFVPAAWSVALDAGQARAVFAAALAEGGAQGPARLELARYLLSDGALNWWTPLTHALLHGSWLHVLFNALWLAAFGTPVARRIGSLRFLGLCVAAALGGALAHWWARPLDALPMIGASGAVSGLTAAAARFIFTGRPDGALQDGGPVGSDPRPSLVALLTNRSALFFIGLWFVTNYAVGVFATPLGLADGGVAWEAHLGGFLVGLLGFALFDRPVPKRQSA